MKIVGSSKQEGTPKPDNPVQITNETVLIITDKEGNKKEMPFKYEKILKEGDKIEKINGEWCLVRRKPMNKEEIIKNIKEMIQWSDHNTYKIALQGILDLYNKEKEKNKELTDKLKDCDLHYSKLYKFHNNNCVTKDRINQIIDELIKLYFEEDSYCFSGFMFNNKTFNSLNIKEEMTVMQLLKHLQRLLKQEEE